jgi:hypothetical protein
MIMVAVSFQDPQGKNVVIEFRFDSDDFVNQAGWYIDDVVVTVP